MSTKIFFVVFNKEAATTGALYEKVFNKKNVLGNFSKFTRKHLFQGLLLNEVAKTCNFIEKETLEQVFSREFCEIFKNTLFFL